MKTIQKILEFIIAMLPEIVAIVNHVEAGVDDEEKERQLAMDVIRAAKNAQARREIEG